MKRLAFSWMLFLLFVLSFPVAAFAGGGRSVTILYTGSVKGSIEPCYV